MVGCFQFLRTGWPDLLVMICNGSFQDRVVDDQTYCPLLKNRVSLTRNSSLFGRTQMVTTPSPVLLILSDRAHYRWWEFLSGVLSENRIPSILSWTCIAGFFKSLPLSIYPVSSVIHSTQRMFNLHVVVLHSDNSTPSIAMLRSQIQSLVRLEANCTSDLINKALF